MQHPIRVAQVMGAMVGGGLEATIMNHYRLLDHDKVQFDFIVQDDSTFVPSEEIESFGGRVFTIPSYKKLDKYMKECERVFSRVQPDIVHSNMNALSVFPLRAAKKVGISIRIAHSHSTANNKEIARTIIKNALRPFSKVYPTQLVACGEYSAEWLFGKRAVKQGKVHYIKNAVDLGKFSYNTSVRNRLRAELGITDKFVVGQIGRFTSQKNHAYALEVFSQLHTIMPNSVYIALGSGELLEATRRQSESLGVADSVYLLGQRDDSQNWYSAFDVLLFPSLYEGLPLTAIEAQASSLPIVASTNITREAFIEEDLTHILSLDNSPREWAKTIETIAVHPSDRELDRRTDLKAAGYDIHQSAQDMQEFYQRLVQKQPRA
ncbi:glycosyl transferase [Bifidobacterium pseudolongum subsp. globosum]|jgi:glycosyltransferase involved in cell wall biosynthesis|uniref:Glycosyl transferase n=1 Tax=Bifidobacterium pseudolongum subsp. globosum TaxID=1690 RepID=A0A4Q5BAV2_9BIFI|nr:glycosyltransferase family 1 protein [Bifidobacterium pseudolongum]RYQ03873.1 glycosyl transferase [Bifidobacterium pseudolongum subsp. globosum]RYQ08743.1 glycosyl transferase [Bifidobacterium pseudolongum subsp. globosum]RYQ12805.1 glycosyl transferase [Bifidobacterium pseudolongum subsp. globosum]RYQ15402.1 glycosyl transferase [Bifidobacterium pseudolongum subsp. globosum]RYQ67439.1 glycosyl transferase [Bifidobacterium pseudolongum subsp. globosum]